jgi:hypothetical protein
VIKRRAGTKHGRTAKREYNMKQYTLPQTMLMQSVVMMALPILLSGVACDDDSSVKPQSQTAIYLLTFYATWSSETHPVDFPPSPHFSGLIGASHVPSARLWEEGGLPTKGIKDMAERGLKGSLGAEIDTLMMNGGACCKLSGGGINPSPGMVELVLAVSKDCPTVSIVSMIAPSPDWFVGVSAVDLFENGKWADTKAVELFPYDAGTDAGTTYTSFDAPTEPWEAIRRIETEPFLNDGEVAPLGTFTFTRLDGP